MNLTVTTAGQDKLGLAEFRQRHADELWVSAQHHRRHPREKSQVGVHAGQFPSTTKSWFSC